MSENHQSRNFYLRVLALFVTILLVSYTISSVLVINNEFSIPLRSSSNFFFNSNNLNNSNGSDFAEKYGQVMKKIENRKMPRYEIDYKRNSDIPNVTYELIPGYEGWYDGQRVRLPAVKIDINKAGFRDEYYPKNKSEDTYRIIAVGDSVTFARGVNISNSYPDILEMKLNSRYDKNIEVLNFGMSGLEIWGKISIIEYKATKYNPDLVIYQQFANDLYKEKELKRIQREKLEELSKKLPNESKKTISTAVSMVVDSIYKEERNLTKNIQTMEKKLNHLRKISEKYGFQVLVFPYQTKQKIKEKMRELAVKNEFIYVTAEEANKPQYYLHPKDPLPNSKGHKIIAEKIENEIYKKLNSSMR